MTSVAKGQPAAAGPLAQPPTPERFADVYSRPQSRADLLVEKEVCGASTGVYGYTTIAQADELARSLGLGPGVRLLDVGAGRGWPGLYLARKTGCHAVITDVPPEGPRSARARARSQRLENRCSFAVASGAALPFRPRVFDAVVHTDVL